MSLAMRFRQILGWIAVIIFSLIPVSAGSSEEMLEISHASDILELRETIGDVRETITDIEFLSLLPSGTIATKHGVTDYNQYLRFKDTTEPIDDSKVVFTESEGIFEGHVGDYLYIKDSEDTSNASTAFFEYEIEFENGLKSDVDSNGKLADILGEKINILGKEHIILDTDLDTTLNDVTLTFVAGEVEDSLYEGDVRTYNIKGKMYTVEVLNVDSTNTPHTATFNINGEITNPLEVADIEILSDGTIFTVTDMNALIDYVSFALDASLIELKDKDYIGNYFHNGVTVNNNYVANGLVNIRGTEHASGEEFEISTIKYRLSADSLNGVDVWVEPGHGIKEYLDHPEGMLVDDWNIRYGGLSDTPSSIIKFDPQGTDTYKLIFENKQNLTYNIPFATNENNIFKYGNDRRELVFKEGFINLNAQQASEQDFTIGIIDSFVLSNMQEPYDNNSISHILRYDRWESSDKTLKFEDMATSIPIEITYSTTTIPGTMGVADLIMGGTTYKVYVANISSGGNPPLAIDLNSDNNINSEEVRITVKGGGILDLGNHDESVGGTWIGSTGNDGTWNNTAPYTISNDILFNLTTKSEDFDEGFPQGSGSHAAHNEDTWIKIESRSNEKLGFNLSSFGTYGGMTLDEDEENENYYYGMTDYGALFSIYDPPASDNPETLTIDYPEEQLEAHVFIVHTIVNNSLPDLAVLNMEYSPTNPNYGDLVTVDVTVGNLGNIPVGNFDWLYDFNYNGSKSRNLNNGENMTIQLTHTYNEPGDFTFYFELDPYDLIEEISEYNNIDMMNIFVDGDVDLIPELVSYKQNFANPKQVTFMFNIQNNGNIWVEGVSYTMDFGDNTGTGGYIADRIYPNEDYFITLIHEYPDFGNYDIKFETDPQNTIEETNEDNNLIEKTIRVRKLTIDGNRFITNTSKSGPSNQTFPI